MNFGHLSSRNQNYIVYVNSPFSKLMNYLKINKKISNNRYLQHMNRTYSNALLFKNAGRLEYSKYFIKEFLLQSRRRSR